MKKEDISGIIVYALIIGVALAFCFTVLREHSTDSGMLWWQYWLYIIGALLTGIIVNAALFEGAHVLGAKLGGYEILSVSILWLYFYKVDGKFKFKLNSYNGLTGETIILPKKDARKEPNPHPYLLLGTLFYAVEIIVLVTLFVLLGQSTDTVTKNIAYFLLTVGVVGGAILIYNILPIRLDSLTDGYRLTLISNPKNREAFNELLRVEYELSQGNTDVEIKTFETITNFTADLNLNKVYALLDKREYEKAEELLDLILGGKEEVSYKTYLRAKAQKIFINLMTRDLEEAKAYYETLDLREVREISHDGAMPSIRTYILIAGLIDRSRSEVSLTLQGVTRAYKKTPKKRRNIEASLYNEALERIIKAHPDWDELPDYLINIESA